MIIIYILLFILFVYLLFTLFLWLYQDKLIFIPGKEIYRFPSDEGMDFEDIDLHTPDGLTLNAWYIPRSGSDKCILFCHGNAGTLSSRVDTVKLLHDMGFSLFIFDYRGYGISDGTPSENGCYIDTETALNYMRSYLNLPLDDIIIWGRSLGGPIAANIAKDYDFYACVLESTFTSIRDMGKNRFRYLPTSLMLTRFKFETITYVKSIRYPLLIVHSPDDEIIPYWMGEKLFETASDPKHFLKLHGGHNNAYFESEKEYREGLKAFFTTNLH